MPRTTVPTFPRERRQLVGLGDRLRDARLRRGVPLGEMAERVGVSRMTMRRLEQGEATVSLATLVRTLNVLSLGPDLDRIASDDVLGRSLADAQLSQRPHRKSRTTPP